jgi:hypothetical protein
MDKTMRMLVLLAVMSVAGASEVRAQAQGAPTEDILVSVNVGVQAHSHSITTSQTFTVYEETATFAAVQGVSGGLLADLGVAYRVLDNLAVGVGVSRVSETSTSEGVAVIPHPIFFDRPQENDVIAEDLYRREIGVHVQLHYFLNAGFLPEGSRLALVGGPSFFRLKQGLVTSVSVPAGTQNAVGNRANESASGTGVNVGFDFSYPIGTMPWLKVGAFVRYAGASLDLESAPDHKVGGFQAGAGARLGF